MNSKISVSRSCAKIAAYCATALLLFTMQASAQTGTVTMSLQNPSTPTPSINMPDFASANETLIDVTFVLSLYGNPVTVYDTQTAGQNLLNLSIEPSGAKSFTSANSVSDWTVAPGTLKLTYTENTANASKNSSAASFLFGGHTSNPASYLTVDFVFTSAGDTNTGGNSTNPLVVPEPAAPSLSLVAASAMALLLAGRVLRRRA